MRLIPMMALGFALAIGMACSVLLDFTLKVECWCGERWTAQIADAHAFHALGNTLPILASDTTYEICVTQLQHLALEKADPQDPLYIALRDNLESGAIANCETAGAQVFGAFFIGTDCATTGTDPVITNIVHSGACWEPMTYDLDDELCPLDSECGAYYDCSNDPIVGTGDDEGGDDLAWECDDPVGVVEREIHP
jgi:hypothetical protein